MAQAHTPTPILVPATAADLPIMQNLGRFYVYDIARYCGALPDFACPADGLWECIDFSPYFQASQFHPFLLRSGETPAGFAVVKDLGGHWNMEQFFIAAPYQRGGGGRRIFRELLHRFPGAWRIEVIPENAGALAFWRRASGEVGGTREGREIVDYGDYQAERIVISFSVR